MNDQFQSSHNFLVRPECRSVSNITSLINRGYLFYDAVHKSEESRQKIIESFICRVPILPIIYEENLNGQIKIVRGAFLIASIFNFINNQFSIPDETGNNLFFVDLLNVYKNRIEDTHIYLYIIDGKQTSEQKTKILELWDKQVSC